MTAAKILELLSHIGLLSGNLGLLSGHIGKITAAQIFALMSHFAPLFSPQCIPLCFTA